jgi:hypothetical protein
MTSEQLRSLAARVYPAAAAAKKKEKLPRLPHKHQRLQSIFREIWALKQIYTRTSFSKGEFWPDP